VPFPAGLPLQGSAADESDWACLQIHAAETASFDDSLPEHPRKAGHPQVVGESSESRCTPEQRLTLCVWTFSGGPIICSTENLGGLVGHFLVLKGIDDDQLFFHDPWRGPDLPQPLSWLNDHLEWEDSDCMLYVDPPR
jgi:Papain-like cysteine protease AvrRpt2